METTADDPAVELERALFSRVDAQDLDAIARLAAPRPRRCDATSGQP